MEGSFTSWSLVCLKLAKLGFENQETGSSKYRYPKQKHMIHWYTPVHISRIHPTHKIPIKIGVDAVFHPLQSQLFRQSVEKKKHCCNHLRGGALFCPGFCRGVCTDVRCSTGCSARKKSTVPVFRKDLSYWPWPSLDHPPGGSAISPTILGVVASTPWKWWWLRVNAVRQRRHFLKHKVHCYSTQGLRPVIKRNSIQVDRDHLNISEHSFWNLKSTSNLPFTISSSTCVTVYSTTLGTAKQLLGGFVDTLPKTKPWKVLMKLW